MKAWDDAIARAYEYQEITLADYQAYLRNRLNAYEKYTDDYHAIWSTLQRLEDDAVKKAEDEAKKAADLLDKQRADEEDRAADEFELGERSAASYRQFLADRLGMYEKYSDDYMRVWRQIQKLDADKARQDEETAAAAKRAADEVKRAEKEAQDAAERAAQRRAMEAITAANIRGATYMTLNTGADPYSVIRAIQQYERNNGKGWRQ